MIKTIIHIVLLLSLGISAYTQSISVEIISQSPSALGLKKTQYPNKNAAYNALKEHVNQLHELGYLSASFDSLSGDSNVIKAHLFLGNKFTLTHLNTDLVDEELLTRTGFRDKQYLNKPFSVKQISTFFERTITLLENNGYPFAQIKLTDAKVSEQNVSATVVLDKGTFYKIDSIEIVGEEISVSQNYVHNVIRIKPKSAYNEEIVSEISQRISENKYLSETRPFEVIFTPTSSKLVLFLKPEKANVFDGIVGFQPDATTGQTIITGNVSIALGNIIGLGEEVAFNWQQLQDQTQQIDAMAKAPYLFKTPFGFGYDLHIYRKDSSFNNVEQRFTIPFSLQNGTTFSGYFNTFSSSLINTSIYENSPILPDVADAKNTSYGLGYDLEKTNNRYNPLKGWQVHFSGAFGQNEILKNPNLELVNYDSIQLKSSYINLQLELNYFLPLKGASTILFRANSGVQQSENLVENQLFRIGGLTTIRGFDQQSLLASSYAIGTIEYRFLFDKMSRISVFYDLGWYENNTLTQFVTDMPMGFGAGISFATNAGIFNMSYALGKSNQQEIDFRSGKIHFGFVSIF